MSLLRILIAEDKLHDVELALCELRREGLVFEHRHVETRDEFLRELTDFQPELVITDYSMPAFTGMEALSLSLTQDAERPVILFTGSINEATAVACLKAGATDYILKEHLTRLPFAVREAVEQRCQRLARREAEGALRERTDELRRYFERSGELLGIFDSQGGVRRLNPQWEVLLEQPLAELEGRSAYEFVPPEQHELLRASVQLVLDGGRIVDQILPVLTGRGVRWLELTASLEDGLIYVAARDVSERLRTEEELAQSRATYEGILDGLSEVVGVLDDGGTLLHVNRAAAELFGHPLERFLDARPEFLFPDGLVDRVALGRRIARVLAGELMCLETTGKRADGGTFPMELSLTRGLWFGREVLLAVARDVSERKQSLLELRAGRAKLADISAVLAARGGDYLENVQEITCLAGRLLQGGTALYNRVEGGRVKVLGRWQVPADYVDGLELGTPFCSRVIQGRQLRFVDDLQETPFAVCDPNIRRFHLQNSLGHPVNSPAGEVVGSLCVVWSEPHALGPEDQQILALLAQALESEEAHRAAAEALRRSEERLVSIFRVAPVGIGLTRQRRIHELNESLCRITGYSREELLDQPARLLYPDERTWEETGRAIYRQMKEVGTGVIETNWRRKDGRLIRVLLSSTPIDHEHVESGVTSAVLDITDRLEAERALRANEQFMRAVLESSPLGISVRDRDGRLLSHNSAWQRIWAIPDGEIQSNMGRVRPQLQLDERDDYNQGWWPEIRRVYREGGQLAIPEARTLGRRAGSAEWVAQHFYAIRDEAGAVDRIVVLTEDISERKRAEEALRQSEAHCRRFFENDLTADYISTADGSLLDCNPAYLRLFGFESREQALETNVTVLYPEAQVRHDLLERLKCEQRLEYEEAELRNLAGEPIHVIMNVLGTFDEDGQLWRMQGYLFDITQYKALQQQFFQAQKMESIGRLAGGVAHDFNNLLTVINGHVDLLRTQFMNDDPVLEQLEQVAAAGERAARLTRQLLAFSRRQVLQLEPVALNAIVSDMNRMLQRLIGEDIRLHIQLEAELPAVLGDVGQLEQVVVNLAVNSRDAMPDGGSLSIRTAQFQADEAYCLAHRPMPPGRYCLLEVSDTGQGMPADVLARVFEPFFTTKEKGKGTGLGLATVYGIVKQIGGYIWVDSEAGRGTVFEIHLPAAAGQASRRVAEPAVGTRLRGSETVLVVEDEEMVRRLAVRILKGHGYQVLEAGDGEQALQILGGTPAIQLVLTDVIMPVMGGRELAERLRGLPQPPRVIFMSGYTEESVARHGILELGGQFIQKPFDLVGLLQKVRDTLDAP